MNLYEIGVKEINKIVKNEIKSKDVDIFTFTNERKIVISFKTKVDINVFLSKEIMENSENIFFIIPSNSTFFGGSNLNILTINNCRVEVSNNCKILSDNNSEIICQNNNNIDCKSNCKITVRKKNNIVTGKNCQINYNGHGSDFEKDVKSWTIGKDNKFFVGALEYL